MPYSEPEETVEASEWEGRTLRVTWVPDPALPPLARTRQASGVVFTEDGQVVVVGGGPSWGLPGGHLEPGETAQEAFVREVREEACAIVQSCGYLGSQRIEDPAEPEPYYQARFWAVVRLLPWDPKFEIEERKLVPADGLLKILNWRTARTAQAIVGAAVVAVEATRDASGGRGSEGLRTHQRVPGKGGSGEAGSSPISTAGLPL